MLLTATGLVKQFDADPVLDQINLTIRRGDRIGLVGGNGAGKTTLLRLLAGWDDPDSGDVLRHGDAVVGLLEQHPSFPPGRTIFEESSVALEPLRRMQSEMLELAQALADSTVNRRSVEQRYDYLNERLRQLGAYELDHRVEQVLEGMGFGQERFHDEVVKLSGGEQCRLLLAKLLLEAPDVLLLDEPSNHLDISGRDWLEQWLTELPQGMVIVSHDRYFLDRVANRIVELQDARTTEYEGNYSAFRTQRDHRRQIAARTADQQRRDILRHEEFIRKNQFGQKATQAKDRAKKIEKIRQAQQLVEGEASSSPMRFAQATRTGDLVLVAEDLSKGYDQTLFDQLTVWLERGEQIGIIGPNGCGKSTLLKVLIGEEPPSSGTVRLGHNVSIGYFDQKMETLPLDKTVIEAAWPPNDPDATELQVRNLLARFGLRGNVAFQKVANLSGGQKSRVALVRLVVSEPNLLVLDEPTNHLDIEACEALENSLEAFGGTVLVVSHDRYFLNRVAKRLIVLEGTVPKHIDGNYDRYVEFVAARTRKPTTDKKPRGRQQAPAADKTNTKTKRKFPYRKAGEIEQQIHDLEEELANLETKLADPDLYRDGDSVKKVRARHDQIQQQLPGLYEHWEEAVELNG